MMTCTDQNRRLPYSHLILRNLILAKIKIAKLNNPDICEQQNEASSRGSIQQHGSMLWTEEETPYRV